MPRERARLAALALATLLSATGPLAAPGGGSRAAAREVLLGEIAAAHGYPASQIEAVRVVLARSGFAGPGNDAIARHPLTPGQCRSRRAEASLAGAGTAFARICGGPYMAPLYDPELESPEQARACIDQFEFPDIPCAYPLVWVRAAEAAGICAAIGKRLCDAHEWEGACAGRLLAPDYRFDLAAGVDAPSAVRRMRATHNRDAERGWSYGPDYRSGVCATAGHKSPGCEGGGYDRCGSNTFPAGAFPGCVSRLGVYDLHGNAAEHMNLPLAPEQMASRGSLTLGHTEMKGSWFVFDDHRAHQDWCRWRAPFWHGSRVLDPASHANYHLGFRCCKDVAQPSAP